MSRKGNASGKLTNLLIMDTDKEKLWIAVAEALGVKVKYFSDIIPDYPNDLNACHEFEKTLSREQAVKYRLILARNSDGPKAQYRTVEAAMCHATAEQRCRAFLATKGAA